MLLLNPSFEVLRKKANEKGVSIYAVAKAVGFSSKSTLYDWHAGKYSPKADKLIKLAEYFGCDVMDFYKE
jgi:transcriptional regulator with XRE-family HTH domain